MRTNYYHIKKGRCFSTAPYEIVHFAISNREALQ